MVVKEDTHAQHAAQLQETLDHNVNNVNKCSALPTAKHFELQKLLHAPARNRQLTAAPTLAVRLEPQVVRATLEFQQTGLP